MAAVRRSFSSYFETTRISRSTEPRELGEETLDEIESGAVLGREGEREAVFRLLGAAGFGFLGNMRRMIVEDHPDSLFGG